MNMKYKKKEFFKVVADKVSEVTGNSVDLHEVLKNNGQQFNGLTIHSGINIAPCIYLDPFFENYRAGEVDIEGVVSEILMVYQTAATEEAFDVDSFLDYNAVKSGLSFKVVNAEANKELLQDCPHVNFLDLAIVAYYNVEMDFPINGATSTILIKTAHLDHWNIDSDTLIADAMANSRIIDKPVFNNMIDIMKSRLELIGDEYDDIESLLSDSSYPMYVLADKNILLGARYITDTTLLYQIADKLSDDLYILPSSIHELIIIPASMAPGAADLSRIVKDVNAGVVTPEEYLSDNAYVYSREYDEVWIAK